MIVYVDIKNGKVDLTKEQLDKLLSQKYNEGYADGKKVCSPITYSTCPYSYWNCPYHWTNKPYITWTSSNSSDSSDNTITCSDTITSTTGTVTINYNEVS